MQAVDTPPLSAGQARGIVAEIRANLQSARKLLLDLYNGRGWVALGYSSWRACVTAEFTGSESQLYRELAAAQVELTVSPFGEIGTLPETHARELVKLPPELQKLVYEVAGEGGTITAASLRQLVEDLSPERLLDTMREQKERARALAAADPGDRRPDNFPRKLGNSESTIMRFLAAFPALPTDIGADLETGARALDRAKAWLAGRS